jgi:transcriptional regulator with XRE-family HTH domain
MDDLRMGRAVLVLRRRKGLTQVELARRAGLSASTVSRIERGLMAGLTLRVLRTVAEPLGMRIELRARWPGGDIDRLLDAAHAGLVEACLRILRHMGWSVIPEASFSIYGERGSVDVLAWHPASQALLIVEVKSRIVDVQGLLSALDRKRRLAPRIAAERGWKPQIVGVWLAVAAGRTNRRHLAQHRRTFAAALPGDGEGCCAGYAIPQAPQLSSLSCQIRAGSMAEAVPGRSEGSFSLGAPSRRVPFVHPPHVGQGSTAETRPLVRLTKIWQETHACAQDGGARV